MTLAALWRVLIRRRWVIVPGLLIALVAGAAAFTTVQPDYSQSRSYLLLSPVVTESGRGNPFLQLGNGVGMAASVLSKKVSDGQTTQAITRSEPGLRYTVALDPTTSAPVLVVTAQAPTPGVVASSLDRVGAQLSAQLAALQRAAGAPEAGWVTISPLTEDVGPKASYSGALRTAVAAVAGVLVLVFLLAAALEARRAGAERRHQRGSVRISPEGTGPADDAEPVRRSGPVLPVPVAAGSARADRR
jgi:hypothetical protein